MFGVPWLPKLHGWAAHRCYWDNEMNCWEKKTNFLLYIINYKGLKILIKSMLIRARGKNPVYWRRGSGTHIKTLNGLMWKWEEWCTQHMLGSFYGCSHNDMSCCSCRWTKGGGWWDTRAFPLQLIQKQTIKRAAPHMKTPLWNNVDIYPLHCTLLPACVALWACPLGLLLFLFHVSPGNTPSCCWCH